ncbi:hypothetical protein GCM10025875_02860 [Litorihabitans aurantiacus]|uniref:ABC transporter domain-containing protein n=2 Tax=Litorihabitans aurantiacus TaxID=1930061 RepID=A0AA37UH17_9MICO|nr:hypothetical protein GCM10025875_02860 [Litorihabitans aurantiacus]
MPNASDTLAAPVRGAAPAGPAPSGTSRNRKILAGAALAVGLVVVALFPSAAPNAYILSAGVVILSYACTATSWNFMGGFTGYISLGHAAWFGLGAYGTGILIRDAALPSFVAWALAGVIVAVITVPVGIAALRVRGASFVIVSIAFVLIMLLVFQGWGSFTGGSNGLVVPRPFPDLLRPVHHQVFFYLFAALLAVMLLLWWAINRSRFGIGLKAIREDEDKAEALGIPTRNYKLVAYVISATFTGLAGGMYALWFGDLDPIFQFSILLGSYMVLMALLGGIRNLWGPLVGAIIVGIGLEVFKLQFGDTQFHLVATGLLLALVVLFMPDGIIPAVQSLLKRFGPQSSSIREMTAAELAERNRAAGVSGASVFAGRPVEREGAADEDAATPPTATTTNPGGSDDRHRRTGDHHRRLEPQHARPDEGLRRRPRRRRRRRHLPRGQDQRPHRPERLRQDDVLQLRHRHDQAGLGHGHVQGPRHHGQGPARHRPRGDRAQLPAVPDLPRMTVLDNVLVAVRRTGIKGLLAPARTEAEVAKARQLLVRVGIDHLENSEARDLSYGQQKLLELAGVLMGDPDTIMLDEPAGGVNPSLIGRIGSLVQELNAEGTTFLIVEHNMDLVMSLSHHVVVFDRGAPIAEGTPDIVQSDPRVLEAYLGV